MTPDLSFEQEIKKYLKQQSIKFSDLSSAYDRLDFTIFREDQPAFHFDAKEKRQTYNLSNWPKFAPETDLFILDDLAVRKCLAYAPKSGILIRDNLRKKYFFFSIIDLALMPRVRVNRSIHRNQLDLKGKWLINFHNGKEGQSLDEAISHIRNYLRNMKAYLFERHECYGVYVNENIEHGGMTRRPAHWDTDVQGTR